MKKSLIWMLTIVMSITFFALLYFQIMYLENMVKMREEQFSEGVMRSLNGTAEFLERQEALHFLEEDVSITGAGLNDDTSDSLTPDTDGNIRFSVESPDGTVTNYTLSSGDNDGNTPSARISFPSPTENVGSRFRSMQEVIRNQYLYQRGLLNEVILSILRDAGSRPIMERADSVMVKNCLSAELSNNGLKVPFVFAVLNHHDDIVYSTDGYNADDKNDIYSIGLFQNTDAQYKLNVQFPTKNTYIFSSVRFIIPTLAFTLILLVIFIFTIVLAFRQKKLSEMKTDFINNMTHELKTPISTISLAGQMLSDESVRKSPTSLKHLSDVITEETKRLRFQVEKVLQMSVFDNTGGALKFTELDANQIIENVVHTFKIKVEKFGGSIVMHLDADDSIVRVDEMQFTNVIFNLLDNAVKYRNDDVELHLEITTRDLSGNRMEIRVKDNGIGIKKDDLKRIFDKFYRVTDGNKYVAKGFGLGLAYVKKMISLFGGSITAESEFGSGSEFIIILPLME